ncbi:MAG: radical SAM protein [Candidatus Methanoperedens sp.]|nr:radical SAM protein [Candidatus Methanoperedens sp.]MCZ7370650.1 radical SAM protein [Candidatus Methanoperedens sp.]
MMKISISYPPIESPKGTPLLAQNRQFQWFNNPTYIYPMVPAYAATLLKGSGYQVIWDDGIAENKTYEKWRNDILMQEPDVIAIETKTPVVKRHWNIIDDIKRKSPDTRIVLAGDHATALPQESMENCEADFILTGGDYDFLLLNLADHLAKGVKLEPGIWYRKDGTIKNSGLFKLDHDLNELPFIDRDLTKWKLYSEKNGNYKRTPGTYTMVGRDCWHAKCTFCSWTTTYPSFRARTPEKLLDEIGMLIEKYKVKEIMDDTGTFPVGNWLHDFCTGMIERGYNKKINIHCNMRVNALMQEEYDLMANAGFRFILYGVESANQGTLDRINKGTKVEDIPNACMMAKKAGLDPHLTVMLGYPWETKTDALQTVKLAQEIFKKGWADTLQATIVIPYPGTPLYRECKENGWLVTEDWDRFDMREAVMKCPITEQEIKELTQELYKVFITPGYILRRLLSIRNIDDLKFIKRGVSAVTGHLTDFSNKEKCDS